MEIFGSNFDDSVFIEARERVAFNLTSYKVKSCEPEWFCEHAAIDTEDSLEKQKVFKFRGDLALRQGRYQNALDSYKSCLEWVPDNNISIRREVLEGIARSYIHLGQRDKALDMATLLVLVLRLSVSNPPQSKEASNTCHLTNLLMLNVSIHQQFGAIQSKMASLEKLCCLLPYNPWHWYNLGTTCLEQMEADALHCLTSPGPCSREMCDTTTQYNGKQTEKEQEPVEENTLHSEAEETGGVWLKTCMCFIRTRLLLKFLKQQQSSFVLQRSKSVLQRTGEVLERLNPSENTQQTLIELMSEDLISEKMREENQDGESLACLNVPSFRERWWNNILATELLKTDGPQCQNQTNAVPPNIS